MVADTDFIPSASSHLNVNKLVLEQWQIYTHLNMNNMTQEQ